MTRSVVNRYAVEAQIGRGGMATVWRATDTLLGRHVALKRLRPSLMDDAESAERFRREAETVARLTHPGLVRLLDRGEDSEGPFLVMELVEGEDLKARIRRDGPLPPPEAARICAQVARALEHAHRSGIVHRDIKSQNVLLDREGRAKLTDFGIARLMEAHADSGLTRTGMLVGSSDYLAPEQAEGRPIDGRTDVYSLGIVLWECLTGRLPFPADSFLAVAMRHVSDPLPDPRTVRPGIPAHIAACCMRAAAKDPGHRFESAARLADALEDADPQDTAAFRLEIDDDRSADDTQRGRRGRGRRRAPAVLAAVVTGAVVATGAIVGVQALQDGGGGTTDAPEPRRLAIASVQDHDPVGGDGEQPGLVAAAWDGDPATSWSTEFYEDVPEFGGFAKDGVGLIVTLDGDVRATRIDLTSDTPGFTYEIRDPDDPDAAPLAEGTFEGAQKQIALAEGAGSRLLVWITRLSPVPDDQNRFHAEIGEVSVLGVPNTVG